MSNEMDAYRLEEALDEYKGYSHDIKLSRVHGTLMLGELVWMLKRITELEFQASCTQALLEAQERYVARIAELEKAFSLLIAVTVNGRIIKGRVGDYYQPQVPVAEIDNARKALKESGE